MILKRVGEWISQIGLFLIFSIVLGLAGSCLISSRWGIYGAILGLGFSTAIARFSNFLIPWIHGATQEEIFPGLQRSIDQLGQLSSSRQVVPRVLVYSEPIPQLWVIRGAFDSRGTLVVSQGLISVLREEDLRVLLSQALKKLSTIGVVFLSYNTILLLFLLKILPHGWMELLFSQKRLTRQEEQSLNFFGLAVASILFPFLQILIRFVTDLNRRFLLDEAENEFEIVLRKIQYAMGPWQNNLSLADRLGTLTGSSGLSE
jgi:hypothetical protein